jgi:hypothetical protein
VEIYEFFKQSWAYIKRKLISIKTSWNNFPEQVKRLTVIAVILITLFFISRNILIPADFGEYGHYRTSAVTEIVTQEIKYAGRQICYDCHDDVVDLKQTGYHKNLSCEVCHGPAAAHTEDEEVELAVPRERGHCPICHEYLPSRPTGFPQIIAASHNPNKPCIKCHDPHDPIPSETPKDCEACHAEIANSKSLSKHVYIPCIKCHETPEQHKVTPRQIFAGKPTSREFCGGCHGQEALNEEDIPRIDMQTHEKSYVCWQCHYPHQPEAQ